MTDDLQPSESSKKNASGKAVSLAATTADREILEKSHAAIRIGGCQRVRIKTIKPIKYIGKVK